MAYIAIGTTSANEANIETSFTYPFHCLPDLGIHLLGPVGRVPLSGKWRYDGNIGGSIVADVALLSEHRSFVNTYFGGWTTANATVYVSLITEDGYYSPFQGQMKRPVQGEDYTVAPGGTMLLGYTIRFSKLVLQTLTKTANYTVTTSDRLIYCNTSGGSITLALPALAGVTANTVYSFQKTSASNSLVIDPDGAEQIDGAATKTLTANYARVDIIKSGSAWVTVSS